MSAETMFVLLGHTEANPEDDKALTKRALRRAYGLKAMGLFAGPIPEDKTEDRVRQLFQIPK